MNSLNIEHSDHNREWLTPVKIVHLFQVLFNKEATKVLDSVKEFWDISFDYLQKKWKSGIILDIDECIAPHHWKILEKNEKIIIDLLIKWWEIVIFSNMKKSDRYTNLEELWIKVVTSKYAKPDKRWFNECVDLIWKSREELIMIWDNFLTDWWSISAGIDFIKVEPIFTLEDKVSFSRTIQIYMRKIVDKIAVIRWNIDSKEKSEEVFKDSFV